MKKDKRRRFFTVLPLLVVPFLAMGFYALGGGRSVNNTKNANEKTGLNLQLPRSTVKEDKKADKLSFYEKATRDSLKFKEALDNDPYYKKYGQGLNASPYNNYGHSGDVSERIMNKIAALNKAISEPPQIQQVPMTAITGHNADIEKLQNIASMIGTANEPDT